MERNFKYRDYYTYDKDTKLAYYKDKQLPLSHVVYKILDFYKQMLYLDEIKITKNDSLEEAHNGLVYRGVDTKGRHQYCYGINYIKKRKEKKFTSVMNIFNKIDKVKEIIDKGLSNEKDIKGYVFASILLTELAFFFRLGKERYYNLDETIGLLTLRKDNLTIDTDKITISFKGKSGVNHSFVCSEEERPFLFRVLKKLHDSNPYNPFLFVYDGKTFTEKMLNTRLKEIGVTFKEFRTYGANLIFLKTVFNNLNLPENNKSKIIKQGIKDAAEIIGHEKATSKKSYLSEEIIKAVEEYILDNYNKSVSSENFIKIILSKCNGKGI